MDTARPAGAWPSGSQQQAGPSALRSTELTFDWHDESTWGRALAGTSSAYVTFKPDITIPGALEILTAFGAAAREHGLDHIVMLSGRGEEQAAACEVAVAESGVTTTIVRSAFFAQNFSEGFLAGDVQASVFALPAGDVTEPIVDINDVADVAVAACSGRCSRAGSMRSPARSY